MTKKAKPEPEQRPKYVRDALRKYKAAKNRLAVAKRRLEQLGIDPEKQPGSDNQT